MTDPETLAADAVRTLAKGLLFWQQRYVIGHEGSAHDSGQEA